MTSGGNNFNYFPENQLTKFKLCPLPNFLIFVPQRICVTHFASRGCLWTPLDWKGPPTDGSEVRQEWMSSTGTYLVGRDMTLLTFERDPNTHTQ